MRNLGSMLQLSEPDPSSRTRGFHQAWRSGGRMIASAADTLTGAQPGPVVVAVSSVREPGEEGDIARVV